jgi:hypothetical protein
MSANILSGGAMRRRHDRAEHLRCFMSQRPLR